jgi:hypothetical protein
MRPTTVPALARFVAPSLLLLACKTDAAEASKDAAASVVELDGKAPAAEPIPEPAAKPTAKPAAKPEAKAPVQPTLPTDPALVPKITTPGVPTLARALKSERAWLHPLADGGLLVSVGPQIYTVDAHGALVHDPSLLAGLPAPYDADETGAPLDWYWELDITGRWPDGVFASYWIAVPPNIPYVVRPTYRLRDGRFEPMKLGDSEASFYYVDARPYVDGSVLSLKRYQALPPKGRLSDCFEDGGTPLCNKRLAAVERKALASRQLVVTRGLPKGPDLAKALGSDPPLFSCFDSLPSGHVFAATHEERARMVVASPSGAKLMALPGAAGEQLRIHVVRAYAEDLAFAAGGEGPWPNTDAVKLFRWDGRAWTEEPAPSCEPSTELFGFEQLSSGERFALCGEQEEDYGFPMFEQALQWQKPGQGWVALEHKGRVLARRGEHVWVADEAGVSTTEPVAHELTAETREALDRKLLADGPEPLGIDSKW